MNQQNPNTAVATRSAAALDKPIDVVAVTQVTGREQVERIETQIIVPMSFQYVIKNRKNERRYNPESRRQEDNWVDANHVGLTSDGYDYINRIVGASFYLPDLVPDEFGKMVSNPIHRDDYIYMRMGAVWYNAVGQLLHHVEDLEVNYKMVWYQARLKSPGARLQLDDNGQPVFDRFGMPMVVIGDHAYPPKGNDREGKTTTAEEQERKALDALMTLRSTGGRYAQTVGRVRLLKVATGIKSLPVQEPADFRLTVVGYRDRLDPMTRIERAQKQSDALYGRQPDAEPLSFEELQAVEGGEVGGDPVIDVVTDAAADAPGPDEFDYTRG